MFAQALLKKQAARENKVFFQRLGHLNHGDDLFNTILLCVGDDYIDSFFS
jgi:hypothetical protein